MNEKITLKDKILTYYSYNKYKLPILFSLVGMVLLTAFPTAHYKYWYEKESKFNAVAVFVIMILALIQFVNSINLSSKRDKLSQIISITIFTGLNVLLIFFAYLYVGPYFNGFNPKYLKSILIISSGVVFFIIANVFAFIYLGYDTKKNLRSIIEQLNSEEESNE